jgi:hypothetical protein
MYSLYIYIQFTGRLTISQFTGKHLDISALNVHTDGIGVMGGREVCSGVA